MKTYNSLFFVFIILISSNINAEVLCAKNKGSVTKLGKVTLSKYFLKSASACPNGYSSIVDTSALKGDKGNNGANGKNGKDGAAKLEASACRVVESQRVTVFNNLNVTAPSDLTASCNSNEFMLSAFYWGTEEYTEDFLICWIDGDRPCYPNGLAGEVKTFDKHIISLSELIFDESETYARGITEPFNHDPADTVPAPGVFDGIDQGSATITENSLLTCCALS